MNKSTDLILECSALKHVFMETPAKKLTLFEDLNFQAHVGEQIAIMGRSGSGKTTLLQLLAGLDSPTEGEVIFCGQSINTLLESEREKLRNKSLGFIYQLHHLLAEFTAFENIAMPLLIANQPKAVIQARVNDLLEKIGLIHRQDHKPAALSGGERQRVAIARALANQPSCILADEPTGNLDSQTANHVFELLQTINQTYQTTFIMVTHDYTLAKKMDRIYILEDQKLRRET